jgi:NhaP-type Na+/H+ or K+/H+ antiporter
MFKSEAQLSSFHQLHPNLFWMMSDFAFYNPTLTVAFAMAAGMVGQSLAYHIRIPGIVILLVAGVALGPDVAGIIQPASLGPALGLLTGFAVAVILFEGGMNLKVSRLRREQRSIRQLITIGAAVTVAGGTLGSWYILEWNWQISFLFGTLVMVTGPTVINPLLRRLKVKRSVSTILEAEGVLLDAIGAVVATVALEAALSPASPNLLTWLWHIVSRLGFGGLLGLCIGYVLVILLRSRNLIPDGVENVFTLCIVLALFQGANAIVPESGIASVTTAGIVVGNFSSETQQALAKFKEELTVMLIGMLFVLLAADVRLSQVRALGAAGLLTVMMVMLVIRPLSVLAGTLYSNLQWREKVFLAWIGPRGIVAAGVASLFAAELHRGGLSGGTDVRALVFMVITITVLFAGLTGGIVGNWLGLRRPSHAGWVILGANELARAVARVFYQDDQDVVCIDSNPDACTAAEQDCTRVIFGNGLQSRSLLRAEIDTRAGTLAVTSNDEVNYLFIQKVKQEAKGIHLYLALNGGSETIVPEMVHRAGAEVAFGTHQDVELWSVRIRRKQVRLQHWQLTEEIRGEGGEKEQVWPLAGMNAVALALKKDNKLSLVGDKTDFREGAVVVLLVFEQHLENVQDMLLKKGWQRLYSEDEDDFTTSLCRLKDLQR